jgi:aspartate/methionine/tyrosine aminotransferase
MEMSRRAAERTAGGHRVLHLELGQPSSPASASSRDAVSRHLAAGDPMGYTTAAGLQPLRERIAQHYTDWYDTTVDVAAVSVVGGASAAFSLAFLSAFDVGILEPGYPCYRNTLLALGVQPVAIPVGPEARWAPTEAGLDEAWGTAGGLAGLIIASPSNPTGTVLSEDTLRMIVAWCARHDVQLIADEIYHGVVYTEPATSVASLTGDAVVINSFSKYFSMTGWRLGWIITPPHLREALERLQQNMYICAPHISQIAGLAAFAAHPELQGHVQRYADNRQLLVDGLATAGIDRIAEADGAFYVYADVSHLLNAGRSPVSDTTALCVRWLEELDLATTPGIDFDLVRGSRFVRFSYAGALEEIDIAIDRLQHWQP